MGFLFLDVASLRRYAIVVIFQAILTAAVPIFKPRTIPGPTDFTCSNLTDIESVRAIFDLYRNQDPTLTLENVTGSAGQAFREKMMFCSNFCTLPFGQDNTDITGIGVFISYVVQILLTLYLGCIHPLASWIQTTEIKAPAVVLTLAQRLAPRARVPGLQDPEPRRLVFTSFYDTSLLVTTSLEIACLKTSIENVGLYQLAYLRFVAEMSFGSLIAAYTLIGKHSRNAGTRFLASLPAVFLFIAIEASSLPRAKKIISDETQTQVKEMKNATIPRERYHNFTLVAFCILIIYFLLCGVNVIYRHFKGLSILQSSPKVEKMWHYLKVVLCGIKPVSILRVLKLFVYLVVYAMAILEIYRLTHLRKTLRFWYKSNGQPWNDDDWGFGQILAVFEWGNVFWEAGFSIFEALMGRD